MNDPVYEPAEEALRRAVEAWRDDTPPDFAPSLARLARRSPPRRLHLTPLCAAALLLIMFVGSAPGAVAQVVQTLRTAPEMALPTTIDPMVRQTWRPVQLLHVLCLLMGYLGFLLVFALMQGHLFLRLWGVSWGANAVSWTVRVGTAVGTLCTVVGTILGAWWASHILGRAWDWHPREINCLETLLIGAAWTLLAWRQPAQNPRWTGLITSVAMALFIYSFWFRLVLPHDSQGYGYPPSRTSIDVCMAATLILPVVVLWLERRPRPHSDPSV
ncbi:MAG: cytochrome c biogenesis protein CcsA [Gemmataceae bacterium]